MDLKIITGMSGAGKTTLKDYFENMGYSCHDNFPSSLIIPYIINETIKKIVFIVDSRTEKDFNSLKSTLEELKSLKINYSLIYLDCNDDVLINRYRETKRLHHFQILEKISLIDAINRERMLVESLKKDANFVFDTSNLSYDNFLDKAKEVFEGNIKNKLMITCMSFGFKHGTPKGIDMIYDVRCFKNPYWVPELKEKTGKDKEVVDYIFSFEESTIFIEKICDLVDFLIPLYEANGKRQLNIAFGCTGGKHRSVCFAEKLYEYLKEKDLNVIIKHIDIKN